MYLSADSLGGQREAHPMLELQAIVCVHVYVIGVCMHVYRCVYIVCVFRCVYVCVCMCMRVCGMWV